MKDSNHDQFERSERSTVNECIFYKTASIFRRELNVTSAPLLIYQFVWILKIITDNPTSICDKLLLFGQNYSTPDCWRFYECSFPIRNGNVCFNALLCSLNI
jgi:hypothetical protein